MGAKAGISGDGAHASSFQEVLIVKEYTKHSTTVNYASVSPHTKDVQTQGTAAQKNAVLFLMWKLQPSILDNKSNQSKCVVDVLRLTALPVASQICAFHIHTQVAQKALPICMHLTNRTEVH